MLSSLTFEDFANDLKQCIDQLERCSRMMLEMAIVSEKYADSYKALERELPALIESKAWLESEVKDLRGQVMNIGRSVECMTAAREAEEKFVAAMKEKAQEDEDA